MLDAETKRRIDTARDILVGKVPDPKSQVEQITIALIYKFMDDMDAVSEELGGTRRFFAGEFARFGWPKLMRSGLGGHEMLNVYAEAIDRMPENPGIPPLFRDIFNNAYLPYRDPETLRAFLKVIDEFTYDHSERLGDAFEYLLSVLGSQGDAGQFRTPRHIIDFIVAVIDPKKNESILDPACGTAGFLISSYKHIVEANTDDDGNSTLTPDEREKLTANFKGYDISPDMVRLSLVNMYLHGFQDPHIFEYDTLTSEDRWNEYADVILANPPFMSPKGGIRPHNRFSVKSKRSEVLFVDYMAEHLTPSGRAGIIVPEGIIFQSQNAHKQLRKMLVEEYLIAVASLPAGVFNPYSGVKTSILILDKALAKRTDSIAFFKVENDGFDLGAQRRTIDQNDLLRTQQAVKEYMGNVGNMDGPVCRAGHGTGRQDGQDKGEPPPAADQSILEQLIQQGTALIAKKDKIAENGEYNLSGERYREYRTNDTKYAWVNLGEIILGKPTYGSGARKVTYDNKVRYVRITDITDDGELRSNDSVSPSLIEPDLFLKPGDLLIARSGSVGRTYMHGNQQGNYQYAGYLIRFRIDPTKAVPEFVYHVTKSETWREWIDSNSKTGTLTNINARQYSSFSFPLPPLDVQREIVEEIEGYQRVINGARAVIENYRPHIPIDPDWPMVHVGSLANIVRGSSPRPKSDPRYYGGPIPRLMVADITRDGMYATPRLDSLTIEGAVKSRPMKKGDVVVTVSGNPGLPTILATDACIHDGFVGLRNLKCDVVLPTFLYYCLLAQHDLHGTQSVGAVFKNLTTHQIRDFRIPLPNCETQQAIVAEIDAEQAAVAANRELLTRFEKKIQAAIGRVWGETKKNAQ